jgi:two-component system CheB/CheR fusion protein
LRKLAVGASPIAQVVVTGDDIVALINQQADQLFGLSHRDAGRLLRDLELSYRPVELRAYVQQAKVERHALRIKDVEWRRPGSESSWFEVHVNPLVNNDKALVGVSIVFHDVSSRAAGRTRPRHRAAGSRLRRTAVDQRRTRDHERGVAVDGRGTGNDQRRTAVDQ